MRPESEAGLSPATVESLVALFPAPSPALVDDDRLAAFALGLLSSEERDRMVPILAASPALRERMVSLRSAPPAELVAREVAAYAGFRSLGAHWRESPSSLAALRSLGAALRSAFASPRLATVRGVAETISVEGTDCPAEATVTESGSLVLRAWTNAPTLDGRVVRIELADPSGGGVLLGEAAFDGSELRFVREGLGGALGLLPGSVPIDAFRVDGAERPEDRDSPRHLSEAPDGSWVAFEIIRGPELASERLRFTIGASEGTARRLGGWDLEARIAIGRGTALLGSKSLRDWKGGPLELEFALPGVPDGRLPVGSVVQTRLVIA